MEALEFMKQKDRMCNYYCGEACTHDDSGETCPAESINCDISTDKMEQLVAIVEKWAKEHPEETEQERQKPEREQQKPEHPEEAADVTKPKQDEPCVKTIRDDLEGAIYRAIASHKTRIENLEYDVSVIRHNLSALHDKIYTLSAKVDHTPTAEPSQTPEPKRTNKDVLLAAFPRMVMDGDVPASCPRIMDRDIHIQHCAGRSCDECRHEYWLAEADEN